LVFGVFLFFKVYASASSVSKKEKKSLIDYEYREKKKKNISVGSRILLLNLRIFF